MKSNLPVPTAKDINEAHRLARSSAETAVQHAIRCGQLLARKKAELGRGEFDRWVKKHCDFGRSMAYNYIKAAAKSSNALDDSSAGAAAAVAFSSLRGLLGIESKPQKKQAQPDTSRSAKGAVMNPPESAAQGSEAGNRNKPVGVGAGQVRPPVPAPVADPDAPEFPDDVDEAAALAAAEADYMRRVNAIMEADDKLAEAQAQLKQQAALIGTLEVTRDGYMRGKEAVTKMLQAEQRKVARLEKELAKLREENEALRERIAIMEAAA